MNDRLPYEEQIEQQWDDLPLPDENLAWEDMKRRLEEDDDNGIIPFWLRGCGLWGLVLVVLVGIGWWLYRQPLSNTKKKSPIIQQGPGPTKKTVERKDRTGTLNGKPAEITNGDKFPTFQQDHNDSVPGNKDMNSDKSIAKNTHEISTGRTKAITSNNKIEISGSTQRISKAIEKDRKSDQVTDKKNINIFPGAPLSVETRNADQVLNKNNPGAPVNDSPSPIPADKMNIDSVLSNIKDSSGKKTTPEKVEDTIQKKDSSKPRSTSFSAGIAMHQLIPIDGQKLTPYNSQGRKGSVADYIPSVFARMYRNDKWFLQAEFRYGAPQYDREIIYQQENQLDSSGMTNTITSEKLKKTFYHQLTASFNYSVLPNFSVGGGFVWNTFKGAVSEQDVVQRTISTGIDTVLSKGVIMSTNRADSNFAKTYFQALVETQYKWKRFSLGARYSFGLQPYLKFNLPGGTQQKERNRSLQVFLRYELWRSKTSYKTP